MRKRIVDRRASEFFPDSGQGWLDLQQLATVEVTSEDPHFPIDAVFGSDRDAVWRASQGGEQLIRVIFDQPVSIRRIQLYFREPDLERTRGYA